MKIYNGHALYERADKDAPEQIKDRNGDIVLNCCKVCGMAEVELSEPCVDRVEAAEAHLKALGIAV
jgi:hypothetical protein